MRLLTRYILLDLLRITVLTATVLVTVIAFGAAIRPLAQDKLLSIGQTAKYIILAMVPMLEFALPFAAGFAGTISLHRFAADNEILAASLAGVSYRRILRPVVVLGLALTALMLGLSQWVIPRFWGILENAVAEDITRVFQATIERGEPFRFGDREIFADQIIVEPGPEGSGIDTRLALLRLAAADLDEDGRIDKDVTASRAVVDVYRRRDYTYLKLAMADTVAYDPDGGVLAWAERMESRTIAIPNPGLDNISHKTHGELLALRRDPDLYHGIRHRKLELAEVMRDETLWRRIDDHLREHRLVELAALRPDGPRYRVQADRLRGGRFANADERPVVVELDDGRSGRRFRTFDARLERRAAPPGADLSFDLVLVDCEVTDLAGTTASNPRRRVPLENLALVGIASPDLPALSSRELLARVASSDEPGKHRLERFANTLRDRMEGLDLEIIARLNRRYALSVTALLLIMLGATLAIWRRESLPLTIYFWAFLPSILDLILIAGGVEVIRESSLVGGLAVLWSGNLAMVGLILFAFHRLSRH